VPNDQEDGAPVEALDDDLPDLSVIAAAERLAGIVFTPTEREQMRATLVEQLERTASRRGVALDNSRAPSEVFDPWLGESPPAGRFEHRALTTPAGEVPSDDASLCFASVARLGRWLASGALTSRRLTDACLARIERLDPRLLACITVPAEAARAAAERADRERAEGRVRGPLHGIPYGAKDLFDTAGIATTFGAEPYRERVPSSDAAVVRRLAEAGAVLVAKTSLGALAYGDQWFGGRTNSPWNLARGSSGSSAGSASGVAAGLFPFAIGSETYGSIISPSARCGTVGLRPTFGRVPRTGAMALCWSLDKVGVIARHVDDAGLVLAAIAGRDAGDPAARDFGGGAAHDVKLAGLRLGHDPAWFEGSGPERAALDAARDLGVELVPFAEPSGPWGSLLTLLVCEAAAAFEDLTRSGADDQLAWQAPEAWPNTFRAAWFVPAIELLQAQRLRRLLCERMARAFETVDAVLSPSFAGEFLLTTNMSGAPGLTLRCGFAGRPGTPPEPRSVTLWGRRGGEGTLLALGRALEERLGVADVRPDLD
jgi:Asp-tRNA(Asn)/Glu-tRNA(Gln) amidotransferase A subunit family amidase